MFGVDDLLLGGLNLVGGLWKNSQDDDRQDRTNQFNAAEGQKTRDFNSAEAAKTRDFNSTEARINREYQERLSNSAYQRSMADMTAAGLNPILAYQRGGASSPTGATASTSSASSGIVSGVSPKETADVVGSAVASAQHNRRLAVELENMKTQNNLLNAQSAQATSAANLNNEVQRKTEADRHIAIERLKPAQRDAVEADIEKGVLQNSAGRLAKQTGYSAQLVKPVADTINSAVRAATPFGQRFHF